jgi:hypothetical protein
MTAKSFSTPQSKQPRSMEADPAFEHARTAFANHAHDDEASGPRDRRAVTSETEESPASLPASTDSQSKGSPVATAGPSEAAHASGATGLPSSAAGAAAPRPPTTRQNPANKMTIYPADPERERLAKIRYEHRVGESFVAEYALEQLFADHSNQEIVSALRARGLGLRRPRTT